MIVESIFGKALWNVNVIASSQWSELSQGNSDFDCHKNETKQLCHSPDGDRGSASPCFVLPLCNILPADAHAFFESWNSAGRPHMVIWSSSNGEEALSSQYGLYDS